MDYVSNNLRKDEIIVCKAKVSWLELIPTALKAIIFIVIGYLPWIMMKVTSKGNLSVSSKINQIGLYFFLVFLFIAALIVLAKVIKIATTHLVITNKRVIGKYGVVKISTTDMPLEKIDNVGYEGGFWGNILHYYVVTISSVNNKWSYKGIANAQEFKNSLTDAIDKRKDEERKAQAAEIARAMGK